MNLTSKEIAKKIENEYKLEGIRVAVKEYHERLNSTLFAFYADTYGHKEMSRREALQALAEIGAILE